MIKLSPDLVFDRGRPRNAVTQRSRAHTDTHTHTPSDKPNYDPVRQPNSRSVEVHVCVHVNAISKANGGKQAKSTTKKMSK